MQVEVITLPISEFFAFALMVGLTFFVVGCIIGKQSSTVMSINHSLYRVERIRLLRTFFTIHLAEDPARPTSFDKEVLESLDYLIKGYETVPQED